MENKSYLVPASKIDVNPSIALMSNVELISFADRAAAMINGRITAILRFDDTRIYIRSAAGELFVITSHPMLGCDQGVGI